MSMANPAAAQDLARLSARAELLHTEGRTVAAARSAPIDVTVELPEICW